MGCAIGKSGLHIRSRPALPPLLLYHIKAGLSIGNLHKKKESFSTLFFDTIDGVEDGELFVTIKANAQIHRIHCSISAFIIDFVFFASAVRAFNFHSITTSCVLSRQGCIRLCIPQRSFHPRNSCNRPHRPWYPS